ncbi:MAG: hypothetical protein IKN30_08230 [Synergistaceae bacterium]|nr:hypothetical protein [Synergistaceae bacterium]
MSLGALIFVKYMKKYSNNIKSASAVRVLSSLRLTSRDIFLVVHCGPDVIAFVLTQKGASFMGRWSYEEWNKSQEQN